MVISPGFAQDIAEPPSAPVLPAPAGPRPMPPHSLSTSKQFVIFADSGPLRAAIGLVAEETREGLGRLLGPEANAWKVPIVVDLRRPPAGLPGAWAPSRLTLGQTGMGLKIQLELLLGESSRGVRLREELVRALLLEIAYRGASDLPAGRAFRSPAPWLVEGCAAWLDARADERGPVVDALIEPLAASRASLPAAEFLSRDPTGLDATSRAIYRAYAYGLLRLLVEDTRGGREALIAQLRELPESADGRGPGLDALLARLLPEIAADPVALDRWWKAGRQRLVTTQRAATILSVAETERQLAERLTVTAALPTPTPPAAGKGEPAKPVAAPPTPDAGASPVAGRVYPIEEFDKYLVPEGKGGRRAANRENERRLAEVRNGLLALGARSHPFYRGIVAGYEAAAIHLGRGDRQRGGALLQTLAAERAQARTRMEAINDYLNWFEATQVSLPSGAFESYFQAARRLEAENTDRRGRRTDPISTYLDAMEAEF